MVLAVGGAANANILARTELFKKESLFGRVRDPASSQGAARGSRSSWPLCSHYVYTDYMTLTQRCTRTATAPVSCVLTGRFFHTHPNYRVEQRGLARAGTRCQAIRSSAGVAPPPGGTAPRTHAALAGMGRKDSKSSRTSRKRDDDSWGDGWEVTHTHTRTPSQELCDSGAADS